MGGRFTGMGDDQRAVDNGTRVRTHALVSCEIPAALECGLAPPPVAAVSTGPQGYRRSPPWMEGHLSTGFFHQSLGDRPGCATYLRRVLYFSMAAFLVESPPASGGAACSGVSSGLPRKGLAPRGPSSLDSIYAP